MVDHEIKLNYDDIAIIPETTTTICTRCICNVHDENGKLPIFVAPMSTVINEYNWYKFYNNGINVVFSRNIPLEKRVYILNYHRYDGVFVAFSMDEAKSIFVDETTTYNDWSKFKYNLKNSVLNICIDVANGHMDLLLSIIKQIKDKHGDHVRIMSGNIANPQTYRKYEEAGCDYVRVSIGTGSGCLTASNSGVFYPPFSLLKEIYDIKKLINGKCKIIADGGIKGYRDIQKALLYADYVMIGGLFNKCIESAGLTTYGKSWIKLFGFKFRNYLIDFFRIGKTVNPEEYDKLMKKIKNGTLELNKMFYGMSTKVAQAEMGNRLKKTSEGLIKTNKVEYNIIQWVENEISYLKSAMSYTNSANLDEYKDSQWVRVSDIKHNK